MVLLSFPCQIEWKRRKICSFSSGALNIATLSHKMQHHALEDLNETFAYFVKNCNTVVFCCLKMEVKVVPLSLRSWKKNWIGVKLVTFKELSSFTSD